MNQAEPRFAPVAPSFARGLIESWLEDRVRGLRRDAARATAGLGEIELPNGGRVPPPDTEYKRARHVFARRLLAAAAIFEAPVTEEEWAGR